MIATILALALAAQAQASGQPAGWELLLSEEGSTARYETASVRGEGGDRVSVRIQIELPPGAQDGMVRMDIRHLLDCGDRTIAYLSVNSYNAQGAPLVAREVSVAEAVLQPFGADSVEAVLHARVCPAR